MGYTTTFSGFWQITPALTLEHKKEYDTLVEQQNRKRIQLPNAPGGYLQWVVNEEGTQLSWDGEEKFYDYVEWLSYMIGFFFDPRKYTLEGVVLFSGESPGDIGGIGIWKNQVREFRPSEITLETIFPEKTRADAPKPKRADKTSILFEGEPKVLHPSDKKPAKSVNPRNRTPPRSPGVLGDMSKKRKK